MHVFDVSCFAISLNGFDVVLGIERVNSLEQVLWDGIARTMALKSGGYRITWKKETESRQDGGDSLNALCEKLESWFEEIEDVFTIPGTP